jgi:hypothetical protein
MPEYLMVSPNTHFSVSSEDSAGEPPLWKCSRNCDSQNVNGCGVTARCELS